MNSSRARIRNWTIAFIFLAVFPVLVGGGPILVASSIFGIYASINLIWVLVWGTAGLFSLGTMTIVGVSGFGAAYLSIHFGTSWPVSLLIGALLGFVTGVIVGLPALRVKGIYYSLMTMGINEFVRVYALQSKELGSLQGGLYGASSFIPEAFINQREGFLIGHFAALALLALALVIHYRVAGGRLGLLLRTARESESTAQVIGIDVARIRMAVFIISSMALGLIGGFYVSLFRSISPNIFSLDTLLLLLAMMVIGGMQSPQGVVLGTAIVVFVDQFLVEIGPNRIIGIAIATLIITLTTQEGLVGIPAQIRRWRHQRREQAHPTPAERT